MLLAGWTYPGIPGPAAPAPSANVQRRRAHTAGEQLLLYYAMVPPLPYPHPSSPEVSKRMRANPRRDTKPEIALRSLLHRQGLRFRKDLPICLPERIVRPDIVFTRQRLAIFIDGCFWHCCPIHGTTPKSNTSYWGPKLQRNVDRDRAVNEQLEAAGWTVIRAWEHEHPLDAAQRIIEALGTASTAARTSGG